MSDEERKFEKLYDSMMDELWPYIKQDKYGPTESEAECIKRLLRELKEKEDKLAVIYQFLAKNG